MWTPTLGRVWSKKMTENNVEKLGELNFKKIGIDRIGKIEDYLSYRSCFSASEEQLPNPAKENAHAGIHMCNRNDIETDAYRGI